MIAAQVKSAPKKLNRTNSLTRPGIAKTEISESIYGLAAQMYGISRYWHKRIVRAGPNTLAL